MAIVTPPSGGGERGYRPPLPNKFAGWMGLVAAIPILIALGFSYWWFVQRVEVPAGEVLVLIKKTGATLPAETAAGEPVPEFVRTQLVLYPELLAALGEEPDSTRYKGIMYEVLEEGRYFYDPFFWRRETHPAVVIAQDEVGIVIRRYGKRLADGKVVATESDERGPLAEVLPPGRHNLNPYAYEVRRVPPGRVPPGYVGVQILLDGDDPSNPNDWVVLPGERGVQPETLGSGLYRNNPYVRRIELIDVRSRTLDLRGEDAIRFPSSDSFEIVVDATVEYAIKQERAPYVMVAIGDHQDIETKLILPYARSLSRIEGSKLLAKEFISGEARERFQKAFFEGLRDQCAAQGIEIRATPIRRIEPPPAIANPISDRQIAEQQIRQYQNEMKVAESEARLVEQEEMQNQNQAIGEANREVVTVVKEAEQRKAVALTEANKRLEVAKLQLEAAREQAAARISIGTAEAEVVELGYQAEAEPLMEAVAAFGGGDAYAQYFFYQKLAPALKSVLDSTDGPFADIFRSLSERDFGAVETAETAQEGGQP
jgi:regulator of protease activity HflC (stomatin/prohibitin superfamily)